MTIRQPSEPWMVTAEQAARRRGFAARAELALRAALEAWCRDRWCDARICHEMVMGAQKVRADVVAIAPSHIAALEVKGEWDDTTRLLHQVGMYQLCVPEVWMVVHEKHDWDAKLIRYLLPSVGLITGTGLTARYGNSGDDRPCVLTVGAEAVPRQVVPEMMLEMMWAAELAAIATRLGRLQPRGSKLPSRANMIRAVIDLPLADLQRECCAELRGRDALWRADPPIRKSRELTECRTDDLLAGSAGQS